MLSRKTILYLRALVHATNWGNPKRRAGAERDIDDAITVGRPLGRKAMEYLSCLIGSTNWGDQELRARAASELAEVAPGPMRTTLDAFREQS